MVRREIDTLWDRKTRNDINDNFMELYKETYEAKEISQQLIDESIDTGILVTNIEERLNEKETQYAPRLTSVEEGLAEKSTVQYETLTVKVPSDYASINAAIDKLSERKHTYGVIFDIILESGYELTIPLNLNNGDYGHFRISSEDDEVYISENFIKRDFMTFRNCRAPILNCLINAQGRCDVGISVFDASLMYITPGSGLKGAGKENLLVRYASTAFANYSIFTDGSQDGNSTVGYAGISAWGSRVYAHGADVSNSKTYGIQAAHSGVAHFESGIANNCGRHGIRATNAGLLDARNASATGSGVHGVYALGGSVVNARGVQVTSAGSIGVYAYQASTVDARDVNANDCNIGVLAEQNSRINFFGGSALNCVESCINATSTSVIVARNTTLSGAKKGVFADEGSSVNAHLSSITSCEDYGIHAANGSNVNANSSTIRDIIDPGSLGHGVYAEQGSKITLLGGSVKNTTGDDLRIFRGSEIVAFNTSTTSSTSSNPVTSDTNASSFNTIISYFGIIWAQS